MPSTISSAYLPFTPLTEIQDAKNPPKGPLKLPVEIQHEILNYFPNTKSTLERLVLVNKGFYNAALPKWYMLHLMKQAQNLIHVKTDQEFADKWTRIFADAEKCGTINKTDILRELTTRPTILRLLRKIEKIFEMSVEEQSQNKKLSRHDIFNVCFTVYAKSPGLTDRHRMELFDELARATLHLAPEEQGTAFQMLLDHATSMTGVEKDRALTTLAYKIGSSDFPMGH